MKVWHPFIITVYNNYILHKTKNAITYPCRYTNCHTLAKENIGYIEQLPWSGHPSTRWIRLLYNFTWLLIKQQCKYYVYYIYPSTSGLIEIFSYCNYRDNYEIRSIESIRRRQFTIILFHALKFSYDFPGCAWLIRAISQVTSLCVVNKKKAYKISPSSVPRTVMFFYNYLLNVTQWEMFKYC